MKIMCVRPGPAFSVADVHRGWVKALGNTGNDVIDFNLDDRLCFYEKALSEADPKTFSEGAGRLAAHSLNAAIYAYWPDVIVFTFGLFLPGFVYELARTRGIKVVLLATESPYHDDVQLHLAQWCDLVLLNDPTNLDRFQEITSAEYVPHAYDPDLHSTGPSTVDTESDFCFVGTGYPSRVRFLEAVDWSGIDFALAGNWEHLDEDSPILKFLAHDRYVCCDNDETVELYRGARVSANLYRDEGESIEPGWAVGPREIELAATGTFFLRDPRPEGDVLFPMLPTFTGPDDFAEKLRWWLAHPDERSAAATAARAAIADRTFARNARQLLTALERI